MNVIFTGKVTKNREDSCKDFFLFLYIVKARMRANTAHSKGGMRQEGREWEGQNSGEQRR